MNWWRLLKMKIRKLTLVNFKAYRNTEMEFSCDHKKNVTIIYGINDTGKTSLFQALNWVLYGDKVEGSNLIIPDMKKIAGKYLIHELHLEDEKGEVKVELEFSHEGSDYTLTRYAYFKKKDSSLHYCRKDDKVELYIVNESSKSDHLKNEDKDKIERIISKILPFYSKDYFLFDGENLVNYIDQNKGENKEIKKAIKQVLGLTDLEFVKANLDKVQQHWRQKYRDSEDDPTTERINALLDKYTKENDLLTIQLAEQEVILKNTTTAFNKNEEQLLSYKTDREKILKRRELENDKEEEITRFKIHTKEIKTLLTSSYLCYGTTELTDTVNLLQKWVDEKRFPAEYYNVDFIEKVLKDLRCFVWDFKKGSKEHKFFLAELERLKKWDRGMQTFLTTFFGDVKKYSESAKYRYEDIKKEHRDHVEIQEKIDAFSRKIEELRKQIKTSITDEEMDECESKRTGLQRDIRETNRTIDNLKDKQERCIKDMASAKKALVSCDAKTKEGKQAKIRYELALNSSNTVDKLIDIYAQEKRLEVQHLMEELFRNMVQFHQKYSAVTLNENYRLILKDRWDSEAAEDISKGAGQTLFLSLIAALAKSVNKDAPFIIDTPFARISKKARENISEYLPKSVTQLILLVTDTELTKQAHEILLSKCEKSWTIVFNEKNSEATLEEGKKIETEY